MAIEKQLFRSGPYADLFSQGVQVGNTLYMAGQSPWMRRTLYLRIWSRK